MVCSTSLLNVATSIRHKTETHELTLRKRRNKNLLEGANDSVSRSSSLCVWGGGGYVCIEGCVCVCVVFRCVCVFSLPIHALPIYYVSL